MRCCALLLSLPRQVAWAAGVVDFASFARQCFFSAVCIPCCCFCQSFFVGCTSSWMGICLAGPHLVCSWSRFCSFPPTLIRCLTFLTHWFVYVFGCKKKRSSLFPHSAIDAAVAAHLRCTTSCHGLFPVRVSTQRRSSDRSVVRSAHRSHVKDNTCVSSGICWS